MLAPEVRIVAMDLLRPPSGYHLDQAILTTYSLDLETLLALPLAVLAHADQGVDALLADPLLLVEGLREAGSRLHVFVDEDGMACTSRTSRALRAARAVRASGESTERRRLPSEGLDRSLRR